MFTFAQRPILFWIFKMAAVKYELISLIFIDIHCVSKMGTRTLCLKTLANFYQFQ